MRAGASADIEAPLVGRARELALIEAALTRVHDRHAHHSVTLAMAGGLGLGKSRLLAELAARANAGGDLVLSARGSEYEHRAPFGVVVDALDDYLGSLQPPELARLRGDYARELGAVFPALAEAPAPSGDPLHAERFRAYRAVRALLDHLADRLPVVLVIDDLHWADEATVELVGHLMRHPPAARVLLAVAYRPAQVEPPFARTIQRSERDGRCQVLDLEPLTAAEAGEFLGTAVPEDARSRLFRESGGNPFFLEQLARTSADVVAVTPVPGDVADDEVPPAVVAAIEAELAAVGYAERDLLSGAAVAGEPFEIGLAAIAAGVDAADALTALDNLLAADLVRTTDAPRRFEFRHPLVRRAVYQAAGYGWRLGAHARVAAELHARGAAVTELADHVARSAAPGDEQAIATLVEAGTTASARAPATAAHWFDAALSLVPESDHDQRLGLLVSLAANLGVAGRLAEARATLHDVLDELPEDAWELRARAVTFIARIDQPLGRHGEARCVLERTLEELPDPRSRAAVLLMLELVIDHLFTAEFEPMAERADAALALAQELGDPLLEAAAWAGVAHARQDLGDVAASLGAIQRSAALLDELDDADCAPLLDTFWWLSSAEDVLELWDDCVRHMERGIELARRFGVSFVFVALSQALAVALGYRGEHDRARVAAQAAVDAAILVHNDASIAYAYTTQCFVHTQAGETREAVRAGELAVEAGRSLGEGLFVSLPHTNLAAALLEAGHPERAHAQLAEARRRGALAHWGGRCWWEIWMCDAELALGRVDEAAAWADQAARTADEMGLTGRRAMAQAAGAAVASARGDHARAATDALDAVEQLAGAGQPSNAERVRILAARALAAAGDRDRAIAELEHARAELTELGAPRLADHAARELRKLGVRAPRTGGRAGGAAGIESLSARERQIADLVATGLTNRAIAADLHLSEKTVENHLSRVFAKLGISSRAALAGAIARGEN